jgi:hypothetical protein
MRFHCDIVEVTKEFMYSIRLRDCDLYLKKIALACEKRASNVDAVCLMHFCGIRGGRFKPSTLILFEALALSEFFSFLS